MTTSHDPDVCCIALEGNELSAALVAWLGSQIDARGRSAPRMVVDCSKVQACTPQGLSALIELGARVSGLWQVVLAALPRAFLRHAIEVGLAERFAIYASVEAAERALREPKE